MTTQKNFEKTQLSSLSNVQTWDPWLRAQILYNLVVENLLMKIVTKLSGLYMM